MVRSRDARWFHKLALAGVAVGVMACADRSNPLGIAPSFDRHGDQNQSGHSDHPWTGRSGSAEITAYALYGSSGTTLTVTSYRETDSLFTTPVGCIDKIQVKVYNPQGRLVSTQNFNDLGDDDNHRGSARSSVSVRVRGAQVGYRLALHVNVSCIDRHRTDVVDADVEVIAPNTTDPAVIRLHVPGTPLTTAPVTISAYVKVTRGLAAATGNCALYVNTVQVATLPTVTIAAGDSVACTFSRQFTTPGMAQVTVAFENVSPTDLNPANNSATTDMPVYVEAPTFSITANLYDDSVTYHNWTVQSNRLLANESDLLDLTPALLPGLTLQQTINSLYPLIDTARSSSDTIGNVQHAQFVGIINTQVRFPLTSLTVSQTSGTILYHRQTWTDVTQSRSGGAYAKCQDLLSGAVSLRLCADGPTPTFPNGWTSITYTRDSSSVAASEVGYKVDYRDSSEEPLANCNTASTNNLDQCYTITTLLGPRLVHYGATYTFNVVLQDPTHRFSATVTTNITRSVLSHTETDPPTYTARFDNGLDSFLRFFFWESVVNDRIGYSGPIADLIGLTETVAP